ncbi:MAG: hypothetical protein WED00_11325 [Aquisalimonadaceae bacterium]
MPLFKVVMRGENFLMNLTGEPELLGFHVTYYVKAGEEAEAKRIAAIKVRKNRHLAGALLNTPQNPNRLACESSERVWFRRTAIDGRYDYWAMDAPESMNGSTS